jgi:hypothetical protein
MLQPTTLLSSFCSFHQTAELPPLFRATLTTSSYENMFTPTYFTGKMTTHNLVEDETCEISHQFSEILLRFPAAKFLFNLLQSISYYLLFSME